MPRLFVGTVNLLIAIKIVISGYAVIRKLSMTAPGRWLSINGGR